MKLNVAILGLGKIADRVALGIINSNYGHLYACVSRDINKALAFKEKYHSDVCYGSYEEALNDEKIDIIYIATINQTHYSLIERCLLHHKHVLCEKPMLKSSDELKALFDLAKRENCFLMEAQKAIFTPINNAVKELIDNKVIGDIVKIDASNCYKGGFSKDHWVIDKEYGGSFKDVGCYPMAYGDYMIDSDIKDIDIIDLYLEDGVELSCSVKVTYDNGIHGYYHSSLVKEMKNCAVIYGTKGIIVEENFWKNNKAYLLKDNEITEIYKPHLSEFSGEIDHACECIKKGLTDSPMYGYKESLAIVKVFELINSQS